MNLSLHDFLAQRCSSRHSACHSYLLTAAKHTRYPLCMRSVSFFYFTPRTMPPSPTPLLSTCRGLFLTLCEMSNLKAGVHCPRVERLHGHVPRRDNAGDDPRGDLLLGRHRTQHAHPYSAQHGRRDIQEPTSKPVGRHGHHEGHGLGRRVSGNPRQLWRGRFVFRLVCFV